MNNAEQYRASATECLRHFEETPGATNGHLLLAMAEAWLRLEKFVLLRDLVLPVPGSSVADPTTMRKAGKRETKRDRRRRRKLAIAQVLATRLKTQEQENLDDGSH